jgi:hypothetical protein
MSQASTPSSIYAPESATLSPAPLNVPLRDVTDQANKENVPPGLLSPRTTATILGLHPDLPGDHLRSIAQGLILTCNERRRAHEAQLDNLKSQLLLVERALMDANQTQDMPEGYEENDGRLPSFYIPIDDELSIPAHWIRRDPSCPTKAQGMSNQGNDQRVFAIDIFATPCVDLAENADCAPAWFLHLLRANSPHFIAALAEADALNDWGVSADMQRYHNLDGLVYHNQQKIEALRVENDMWRAEIQACRYHLEAARTPQRLGQLQGLEFPNKHHTRFSGGSNQRGRNFASD